jgi:hypothetical protein
MNTPGWISKVTHDGSRDDIIAHFNEHHHHNLFEYIGNKATWGKNTDEEIKRIMISIGKKNKEVGFEEYRKSKPRGLSYEDAGHLINTVLIYNKWVKKIKDAAIRDLMDNHCTLEIPAYLKTITNKDIEEYLLTENSKKTYKFLSKKIRNTLEFFYNFIEKYREEQKERDLEDKDKDNIYNPERETAFDKTYKEFFRGMDPQAKFQKENEEIIRIFFVILKEKEEEKDKIENQKKEKPIELWDMKTKSLQENIDPDFQEVDEDGDVIGLTKEHKKWWNIPNPPRSNDPFW